jgi:very-short-patch-repair endonuclease
MQKVTEESDGCREKTLGIIAESAISGVKFRRQFPIGRYILDFYAPKYNLGIEADGGGHYEDKGRKRDELRTQELKELGVMILRFNDREILTNIEGIYEIIKEAIEKKKTGPPHLNPLPQGRGNFTKLMETDYTGNKDDEK